MQIITRYPLFILIAAHLVGLAAIFAYNAPPSDTDAPDHAASRGMGNPFVLADLDARTVARRAASLTIEFHFAHCTESGPTVSITVSDGVNPTRERV